MDEFDSEKVPLTETTVDSISEFERSTPDTPIVWWAALLGPFVASGFALLVVFWFQGWDVAASYVFAAATAFFLTGRFIILLGKGEAESEAQFGNFTEFLDAQNLFAMLTWMDVMVAIFVAFHMSILFRVPWAGVKLEELVSDGRFILNKQPWIRRAAFLGLVTFVIFPTSTTGSVGGTIFGRLLGMNRLRVVLAILIGSVLGNGVMLLFAETLNKYLQGDSLTLRIVGVAAMVVALFLFERKIKSLKQQYLDEEAARLTESDAITEVNTQTVVETDPQQEP